MTDALYIVLLNDRKFHLTDGEREPTKSEDVVLERNAKKLESNSQCIRDRKLSL